MRMDETAIQAACNVEVSITLWLYNPRQEENTSSTIRYVEKLSRRRRFDVHEGNTRISWDIPNKGQEEIVDERVHE